MGSCVHAELRSWDVDLGYQTQAIRLSGQHLRLLGHLVSSVFIL